MIYKNSYSSVSPNDKDVVADTFALYLKQWKWFVAIIFIFGLLAVAYIKLKAPSYSMTASVAIKKEDQKASSMMATAMMKNFGGGIGSMLASESTDDEIQVFSSQNIMRKVVSSLGLYATYDLRTFPVWKSLYHNSPVRLVVDPSFVDTLSTDFVFHVDVESQAIKIKVKGGKANLGIYEFKSFPADIKTSFGNFRIVADSAKIPVPYSLKVTLGGLDPVAEKLRDEIEVETLTKKSDVIGLTIQDEIRQRGKDLLNEIIRQYNLDALSDKNKTALNTTKFLQERIDTLYRELHSIEANIEAYKKTNKFVDPGAEVGITLGKVSQLQEKNSTLDIQLSMIQSIENQIKAKEKHFELLPASIGLPASVATVVDKYNEAVLYRMRILRNSNEANPVIQSIDEQLKSLNKNLLANLKNAKNDIAISKANSAQIESQVNNRIGQMPRMERDYVDLKRQQELKSQIYLFLLQKMEETQMTIASSEAKAKVVDAAYALSKPVSPKKLILLFAAFCVGFFVAALVVGYRIVSNKKIGSWNELVSQSNSEVLGCFASQEQTSPQLLKQLRTNILQKIQSDKTKKVILVSSIEQAQGKTDTAIHLAESLAKASYRTVLVDLNLVHPGVSNTTKTVATHGVSEYMLEDAIGLNQVIEPSGIHPYLDLIPAGKAFAEASEMLASSRLDGLLNQLRGRYDMIVLDSASFEEVPDSLLLVRLSDINLFAVHIGKAAKEALNQLNDLVGNGKLQDVFVVGYDESVKA